MKKYTSLSIALLSALGLSVTAHAQQNAGGFTGPSDVSTVSVADALKLGDDTPVVLNGKIKKNLGNEKYLFSDGSADIVVEIDNEDWRGQNITPQDTIEIQGEIDKEFMKAPEVDVDVVTKK